MKKENKKERNKKEAQYGRNETIILLIFSFRFGNFLLPLDVDEVALNFKLTKGTEKNFKKPWGYGFPEIGTRDFVDVRPK